MKSQNKAIMHTEKYLMFSLLEITTKNAGGYK